MLFFSINMTYINKIVMVNRLIYPFAITISYRGVMGKHMICNLPLLFFKICNGKTKLNVYTITLHYKKVVVF